MKKIQHGLKGINLRSIKKAIRSLNNMPKQIISHHTPNVSKSSKRRGSKRLDRELQGLKGYFNNGSNNKTKTGKANNRPN